ncbi:uncharacterized protein BX664DRAFT_293393 [Halteromyces radiatus]|uniref:uncharacterized protein n=1 Tax=Halteromyces radiatus TaxID=101107 RepID=UPI00222090B7|nr:uncharacterized protein BX664DRAFT_293393 [Halteromyces radiatus]KAI8097703.1 hypothetical protein BX664DRAFT_293393 [Halteromyces radiatus]
MTYLVFYKLPPPIVIHALPLVLLYLIVLCLDYVLLCYHRRSIMRVTLPMKASHHWLLWLIATYHIILPLIVVSHSQPLNVFFTAGPIYMASFTAHLPSYKLLSIPHWIKALSTDLLDTNQDGLPRVHGLAKVARGIFKLSLIYSVLDPWFLSSVNDNLLLTLQYPWYYPQSLQYNLVLGIKAYCLLGVVDIFLGVEQVISGVRFIDLFHSPILSSSPRDFWSRRWNMVVRNQFHHQVFMPMQADMYNNKEKTTSQPIHPQQKKGFWSSKNGRGLVVFMLSGVLHELIIWSTCREITLENFTFFTLHGIAVLVETSVTRKQRRTNTMELLWCRLAYFTFMTLTARLFLAPFVRHDYLTPLSITFSFT